MIWLLMYNKGLISYHDSERTYVRTSVVLLSGNLGKGKLTVVLVYKVFGLFKCDNDAVLVMLYL